MKSLKGQEQRKELEMGNQFIVLEGLSASGKTTIGRILAERMEAVFYKTPPEPFSLVRDHIDRSADASARFLFYLAGVVQASAEIRLILRERPVVCDRYLLTTLCYHRAVGVAIDIPDSAFLGMVNPHHTFLVVCEEGTRIARMKRRGLSYNDSEEERLGVSERFLAEYRKYPVVEIDNSGADPCMAVERIMRILGE